VQLPEYQRADLIGPSATGAGIRNALESLQARFTVAGDNAWSRSEIERAINRSAADAAISSAELLHSLGVAMGTGGLTEGDVLTELERIGRRQALLLISRGILTLSDFS